MILAHWTYSRQEWNAFLKWKKLKRGFFHYFLHWLLPNRPKTIPAIQITNDSVIFNNAHEPFHDDERRFCKINIHDAGELNIMEISYEQRDSSYADDIKIPIPKGKLREAIRVQDQLMKSKLFVA